MTIRTWTAALVLPLVLMTGCGVADHHGWTGPVPAPSTTLTDAVMAVRHEYAQIAGRTNTRMDELQAEFEVDGRVAWANVPAMCEAVGTTYTTARSQFAALDWPVEVRDESDALLAAIDGYVEVMETCAATPADERRQSALIDERTERTRELNKATGALRTALGLTTVR